MLKHDIKNYSRQFTKNLIICFQWHISHTDLVMCDYAWLQQLNVSNIELFHVKIFFLLDQIYRSYKVV